MIKIVKLVTGEELIGDITDAIGGSIKISKPCMLHLVPSRSDSQQPAIALIPYAAYVDGHSVVVESKSIIWSEEPVQELYNQYNSIFGSGLVVANHIN